MIDLPNEGETTIAKLINYNSENEFVELLMQRPISYLVKTIYDSRMN